MQPGKNALKILSKRCRLFLMIFCPAGIIGLSLCEKQNREVVFSHILTKKSNAIGAARVTAAQKGFAEDSVALSNNSGDNAVTFKSCRRLGLMLSVIKIPQLGGIKAGL